MATIREVFQITAETIMVCSGPKKKKPISQEISDLFAHIAKVNTEGAIKAGLIPESSDAFSLEEKK